MEKSNLMMVVIIVLLVALLGTVVGVTFYAFNMVQSMERAAAQGALGWEREVRTLRPDEIGRVTVGDAIITNLATEGGGSGGTARIQVVIGFDNTQSRESQDTYAMINEHISHIRNVALASIQGRSYNEMTSRDAMRDLGDELLERLQNDFQSNMIVEVSFSEWIVQ